MLILHECAVSRWFYENYLVSESSPSAPTHLSTYSLTHARRAFYIGAHQQVVILELV